GEPAPDGDAPRIVEGEDDDDDNGRIQEQIEQGCLRAQPELHHDARQATSPPPLGDSGGADGCSGSLCNGRRLHWPVPLVLPLVIGSSTHVPGGSLTPPGLAQPARGGTPAGRYSPGSRAAQSL